MRKLTFIFFVLLISCQQNETQEIDLNKENQVYSGSFSMGSAPLSIRLNKTVILLKEAKSNIVETRSSLSNSVPSMMGMNAYGPFYTTGKPRKIIGSTKVILKSAPGFSPGVYFAEVWITTGKILLPSNAKLGTIETPNPAGYINWSTQERGINFQLSAIKEGLQLSWNFYTMVIKYDISGRRINRTIPMDGAKIRVPYYYYTIN